MSYESLLVQWNGLVSKINKGDYVLAENAQVQFSPEEIEQLIRLCHPDKHGQCQTAITMTQKLLSLHQ